MQQRAILNRRGDTSLSPLVIRFPVSYSDPPVSSVPLWLETGSDGPVFRSDADGEARLFLEDPQASWILRHRYDQGSSSGRVTECRRVLSCLNQVNEVS